ncbi:MAG: outer membrane translocation and assembly module TamA [Candidatus Latescibacterota bacterium]
MALYQELGPFVIAGKTDARSIRALKNDAEIFEYERFYLGGDRSVRGFERKSIGARRIGIAALSVQSEVRFPLRRNMGGLAFFDAGEVWEKVGAIKLAELRPGCGGGLRYRAPIGLVRFDLGVHGDSGSWGQRLEFYFGIGQGF